ncbi:adult cuticle protein 1-like [Episyrphus balteatus]|uniref:adult cuticle protein 1-like n=1 Tax=Episyrphus balteatus TaxID=286459 RepID=UPI00248656F8|nr:adult cuticle protein 1-like [Episyrphus balteatus]
MKFAVFTVVVLALVFNAHSSVIGLEGLGPILSVSGPAIVPAVVPGGSVAIQASVPQPNLGSVAIQASTGIVSVPSVVSVAQPAVAVALPAPVAPVVVAAEGTYVAKTRGAVHVAPLPGHLQSAASVNLEPAPGTL